MVLIYRGYDTGVWISMKAFPGIVLYFLCTTFNLTLSPPVQKAKSLIKTSQKVSRLDLKCLEEINPLY